MEDLTPYNIKEINFIKLFFRILMIFGLIFIVLFIVFPVNDSVAFSEGEIISENPELEYKAPYEVILEKIAVREGDQVKAGDTLAIIGSSSMNKDLNTSESQFNALSDQLGSFENNIENIDKRIELATEEIGIKKRQFELNRSRTRSELSSARQKVNLVNQKMSVKQNKLKADSSLYKKDVISLIELRNSYDEYLGYKQEYIDTRSTRTLLSVRLKELENDYLQAKNTLEVSITQLQEQKERMIQEKASLSGNLEKEEQSLGYLKEELNKKFIIAEVDGVVVNVFNEKEVLNFIDKGQPIVRVSPSVKAFYAKAKVSERDIKYIKEGQTVNLKLDAYYYYEYGAIRGVVKSVPVSKANINEDFYVIVDIPQDVGLNLKSGFSVRGDIILEQLPLYRYATKMLFRKMDKQKRKKATIPVKATDVASR